MYTISITPKQLYILTFGFIIYSSFNVLMVVLTLLLYSKSAARKSSQWDRNRNSRSRQNWIRILNRYWSTKSYFSLKTPENPVLMVVWLVHHCILMLSVLHVYYTFQQMEGKWKQRQHRKTKCQSYKSTTKIEFSGVFHQQNDFKSPLHVKIVITFRLNLKFPHSTWKIDCLCCLLPVYSINFTFQLK